MSAPPAPHRLNFPELDREIEVQGEETIFHGARRNGLRIVGACGGRGTCGTCVVRVVEGRIDHIHSAAPDLLETDDDAATGPNGRWRARSSGAQEPEEPPAGS